MDTEPLPEERNWSVLTIWRRLPVVARAILSALLVGVGGVQVWRYLIAANVGSSPRIPWAAAVMAIYLWLYWSYLSGNGWPRSTAEARRRDLRANHLSPITWRWALIAGGSFMAATSPLSALLRRLSPSPPLLPDFLQRLPPLTFVSFVLMTSIVAGVVEEAAFRGYLQSPIERRHGPVLAILLTSILFVLLHLPGRPSVSPAYLLVVALASLNYGILSYLTNSILPGLVLHASGDVASFAVFWWFQVVAGPREQHGLSFAAAVRDPLIRINSGEFVVLAMLSVWAFRRLTIHVNAASRPAA